MPAEPWLQTMLIRSIIDELRKNYNHKMHIVVSNQEIVDATKTHIVIY